MKDILLKNISKAYGAKTVFGDFSLSVPFGTHLCIMGESGCGKTTLLNIIMGIVSPDNGVAEGVPDAIAAVFQEDRLCEPFSAVANIRAAVGKSVPESEILACLSELGLQGSEFVPVSTLSGGMRRRVAIARALLAKGDLLILDEPFKGLDDANREKTAAVILSRAKNKTILIAAHDIRDAELLNAKTINI